MSFRRMLTLLAVVFLFAGIAAAQSGDTQPFTCNTVAQVTPTLRAEGLTELVGDMVITCTGGTMFVPSGTTPFIPTANITVSLTNKVTSRLVSTASGYNVSEALLLVDEPGSTSTKVVVPGYGPAAQLSLCPTPWNPAQGIAAGSCSQLVKWVDRNTAALIAYSKADGTLYDAANNQIAANSPLLTQANAVQVAFNADTAAANVYNGWQGIVVGNNQIQFQGIPVLPPVSNQISRVYRITNIRVSAGNSIPVNGVTVVTQVIAYLSNSGSTSLPVNQSGVTVGFTQSSLNLSSTNNFGVYKVNTFAQCDLSKGNVGAGYLQLAGVLRFGELFPSAFKTRLAPVSSVATAFGGSGTATTSSPTYSYLAASNKQNIPGTIYSSESGFITPAPQANASVIGLADNGTRLQAKLTSLPKGVSVYVTRTNVAGINFSKLDSTSAASWAPATIPSSTTLITSTYAEYTAPATGKTSADATAFNSVGTGTAITATVGGSSSFQLVNVTPGSYDATTNTGSSTVTWEVLASNASTNEDYAFLVFVAYDPRVAAPVVDTNAQAALWYGDQSTVDTAVTAAGGQVPRFNTGGTTAGLFNISRCTTVLLFPYVTTAAGYDTGVAISNTSKDPFGTSYSTLDNKCDITPYGMAAGAVSTAAKWTVTVDPGTTNAGLLSANVGTGFTGYLFASCNFQFAHGFAFITNLGATSLGQTMGYLALVVNNGNINTTLRSGTLYGEALNN